MLANRWYVNTKTSGTDEVFVRNLRFIKQIRSGGPKDIQAGPVNRWCMQGRLRGGGR